MLIAEIGLAHDGSLGNALAFIDAVADAGADAVKFQCHDGDTNTDPPQSGIDLTQDSDRAAYWDRTAFTPHHWELLSDRAKERGIIFGCSPFSMKAMKLIEDLVFFVKLSRNHDRRGHLLNYCKNNCRKWSSGSPWKWRGVPYLIGSGKVLSHFGINTYDPRHNLGISDHSGTIWPCLRAAALGAEIFEVHVCWDRRAFGPDASYSLTIDELATLKIGIDAMKGQR